MCNHIGRNNASSRRNFPDPQHHNPTVVTTVQTNLGGKAVGLMGKGLSWSAHVIELLGADMASGKTLYATHRRQGWPYSSVKQIAACLKEGDVDVTFLVDYKRKRTEAHFLRRLDLCIAKKASRFEHLLTRQQIVDKTTGASVVDADSL